MKHYILQVCKALYKRMDAEKDNHWKGEFGILTASVGGCIKQ